MGWCAHDIWVKLVTGLHIGSLRLLKTTVMNEPLSLARRGMGEPA